MRYGRLFLGLLCALVMLLLVGCAREKASTPAESASGEPNSTTVSVPNGATSATLQPAVEAIPTTPDIVATVNGQPIERLRFEHQVAQFQAAMISQGFNFSGEEGKLPAIQVRKQVLEAMIDQLLIDQAIAEQGITVSDAVLRQRIQQDVEMGGGDEKFKQWLAKNGFTMEQYEDTMRSAILTEELIRQLALDVPQVMKQVHVRQILIADETQAKEIRGQLDAGADFSELAKKLSLDEGSRAEGGDRGFLPLGASVLLPEVEAAIASLQAGQIAGPIASAHGYYLIQVVEIDENRPLAPEVLQGMTQETFVKWIETRRAASTIERFVTFE